MVHGVGLTVGDFSVFITKRTNFNGENLNCWAFLPLFVSKSISNRNFDGHFLIILFLVSIMPTKRICALPNCSNSSKKGWTLFSIPKEEAVQQVWCEHVGLDSSNLKSNSLLCQLHFNKDDLIMFANSFRLRPGAVPYGPDISPGKSSDTASSQLLSTPPKLYPQKEQHELTSMKMLQVKL